MKVGKFTVQFNHKSKGYKTIEEVPYWRLYRVKRTKVKERLPDKQIALWGKEYWTHTISEMIDKSIENYKFDDIEYICGVMVDDRPLTKGEFLVAYPRKGRENRVKIIWPIDKID